MSKNTVEFIPVMGRSLLERVLRRNREVAVPASITEVLGAIDRLNKRLGEGRKDLADQIYSTGYREREWNGLGPKLRKISRRVQGQGFTKHEAFVEALAEVFPDYMSGVFESDYKTDLQTVIRASSGLLAEDRSVSEPGTTLKGYIDRDKKTYVKLTRVIRGGSGWGDSEYREYEGYSSIGNGQRQARLGKDTVKKLADVFIDIFTLENWYS